MPSAQIVAVTEEVAGSELTDAPPSTDALQTEAGDSLLLESGDVLLLEAPVLALEVLDLTDFGDGGTLEIVDVDGNSETVDYTVDGDSLSLASALTGTYAQGDRVYVLAADGSHITERMADMLEPQGEETIRARVPHSLYPNLPEGVRDPDEGEMVEFAQDGTDLVITDILGRFPTQDLNSVLVTTDPSQSGERVDINADGIREYEDDGTTVAVSLTQGEGLDFLADTDEATNITRMIRWLLSGGDALAYISAFEQVSGGTTLDSAVLKVIAQSGAIASFALLAEDDSGNTAGIHALTGPTFNGEVYVESHGGAATSKLLLDQDGTSDFELAASGGWQDWTPTLTGWSSNPSGGVYRYKQTGSTVHLMIRQPNTGTSNATTKTISLPVTAATITDAVWSAPAAITDNGTAATTWGRGLVSSGGTTASFLKDAALGAFTSSGSAAIRECQISYEAA